MTNRGDFLILLRKSQPVLITGLRLQTKGFDNKTEAEIDYEHFLSVQDTDFTEFCNDIFGDG